jgi:hypothetical protein
MFTRTDLDDLMSALVEADRTVTNALAHLPGRSANQETGVLLESLLGHPPDLVHRRIRASDGTVLDLLYLNGLVDQTLVMDGIIKPLNRAKTFRHWDADTVPLGSAHVAATPDALERALLGGQALLGPGQHHSWYAIDVAKPPRRTVDEPKVAQVTHGPHTGFIEDLSVNLALIRHFVASPLLTMDSLAVGRLNPVRVVVIRLIGVSRPGLAAAVKRKLARVKVSGVVDSSLLMGFLGAHAIVPTVQYSERPDQVAAALMEGRVAVMMDRSPTVLLLPTALTHLLTTPADYYQPAVSASLVRLIRYAGVVATVFLPAVYVGVITVNQPLVPLPLWLSFVRSRLAIPFPIVLETLIMLLAFDLVYEAGLQVPSSFGQTVSVVGALVIGQAAVMAGIVSAPTLIAVAFSYLTQLLIPDQNLAMVLRILRYPVLLIATVFGLVGVTAGFMLLVSWAASLKSYGVSYLSPLAPLRPWSVQDAVQRGPWGHRRGGRSL